MKTDDSVIQVSVKDANLLNQLRDSLLDAHELVSEKDAPIYDFISGIRLAQVDPELANYIAEILTEDTEGTLLVAKLLAVLIRRSTDMVLGE